MSNTAIKIDNLGKMYKLGLREMQHTSFREALAAACGAPLRRLRHLSARTWAHEETFWALKDVSFEVDRGEVLGIIGHNGAGKSTLLKILSRITEPTTGRAELHGRVASLLEVGTGFHVELTGRDNIYLKGAVLGMSRREIDRKFDEIVAFAGVDQFLDTQVKHYSSGMTVRLGFAVAAYLEPDILIVDEVLAVGDVAFQRKCLGKMQQVSQGEGRTVLFVSHNMAAVQSLCTRAILFEHGNICVDSNVKETCAHYFQRMSATTEESTALAGDEFEIEKVEVHANGHGVIHTFSPANVVVAFKSKYACRAAAHVQVEDASGMTILGINSSDFCDALVSKSEKYRWEFGIRSLPLIPGEYYLRITLRNDSDFRGWKVPKRFPFTVHESNVYGARKVTQRHFGVVAVGADVSLQPALEAPTFSGVLP
jgi:lipopolysaccharide transport system ATP-binding protein